MTCSSAAKARFLMLAESRPPKGWGMLIGWKSGCPKVRDWISAESMKGEVQITTVGTPRFSRLMASCTLHAVQEPQSAIAVITKSHLSARESTMSVAAGRE